MYYNNLKMDVICRFDNRAIENLAFRAVTVRDKSFDNLYYKYYNKQSVVFPYDKLSLVIFLNLDYHM